MTKWWGKSDRESGREKKGRTFCLVDIHREDYEVMQRWLQSSPMLHTSIESPSHPSLQTPLATTINLSALPLHVKFSLFFPSPHLFETTGRLARSQLSCEEPHVVTALAQRARTCVFGRIGFPLCRHHLIGAAIGRSGPAVIFQRRVAGKEWRSNCLAAFFIFF